MNKHIIRNISYLILVFLHFAFSSLLATAQISVTAGNVNCKLGDNIEIPISVNSISGANQLSLNIPYASTLLYFSSVSTEGTLSNGANITVNALANGKTAIIVNISRSSTISGNGVLFRLRGKCIGQGNNNNGIRVQSLSLNGTSLNINSTPGSVNVSTGSNLQVWVDPKGRVSDGQYAIDIKMSNPDGWGVYSYLMELEIPIGSMRATNFSNTNTLSDGMFVAFNNSTPGSVVVSAAGTKEIKGNTQLLLRINVNQLASPSAIVPITIRKFEIDNGSPKPDIMNAQWNPQLTVPLDSESVLLPSNHSLGDIYPNPFNPSTTIPFNLSSSGDVTVTVHDVLGRIVDVVMSGTMMAGHHEIRWNSNNLPSGIYLIRLSVGGDVFTQKVTLLK